MSRNSREVMSELIRSDDKKIIIFIGFYFPVNYMEGVQVDFQKLAEWTSFDSKQDYLDLIQRFETNKKK